MLLGGGNSESKAAFLGDDDQDDSIEDILIPSDVSEEEAHERITKSFAKKQSSKGASPHFE